MKLFSLTLISVLCCSLSSCDGYQYVVMTITGNQSYGESDGIAYIGLKSKGHDTLMMQLNREGPFRPGQANSFDITTKIDIGEVTTIKIEFACSKTGKRLDFWFLNGVVLYDTTRNLPQYYECSKWLNATQNKNATLSAKPSPHQVLDYKVIVETGDDKDAGTHGKVYITLLGTESDSRKILLDHEGKPEFQRSQTDTFYIHAEDIGDISRIRIELDSTAESNSPNWFLKAVSLVDEESKQDLWFPWNQWLTPTAHQKTISVEIPISTKKGKQ